MDTNGVRSRRPGRTLSRTKLLMVQGYSKDAAAQLESVQRMINQAQAGNQQDQAVIALATENAAKTVEKMCRILSCGGWV